MSNRDPYSDLEYPSQRKTGFLASRNRNLHKITDPGFGVVGKPKYPNTMRSNGDEALGCVSQRRVMDRSGSGHGRC
jgi:hypothetical protein